jgi:hypothetical protein
VTGSNSNTPTPNIPSTAGMTVREFLEAQVGVNRLWSERIDALEAENAALRALFVHKDGRNLTNAEAIARLDHRINMQDGEIMALIGEIQDMRNEVRTIHHMITNAGRYGVRQPRRPNAQDGPSPYDASKEK